LDLKERKKEEKSALYNKMRSEKITFGAESFVRS
jgi:hypothetical protein